MEARVNIALLGAVKIGLHKALQFEERLHFSMST